jgi:membrane protease YdiL (CAAX protease family)
MNENVSQCWRPRDAWFFAGVTFLLSALVAGVLVALASIFRSSAGFLETPAARATSSVFGLFVIFGVSLAFAKVKSLNEFIPAFGLTRPDEREILIAVAVGLLIQFVGIAIFNGGLSHLQFVRSFQPAILPVLLAPFLEEPAMRGFAYKAFRNAYSVTVSICLVVAMGLMLHWGQVSHSLYGFVVLASFNVALCLLREKYSSLWNCIACHLAFNLVYVGIEH